MYVNSVLVRSRYYLNLLHRAFSLAWGTVNFVSREGNIEIRGKQNSLLPKEPVIK